MRNKSLLVGAGVLALLYAASKKGASNSPSLAPSTPTLSLLEQAQETLGRILSGTPSSQPTSTGTAPASVQELAVLHAQGLAPNSIYEPNYFAVQDALEQAQSGKGIAWVEVAPNPTGNPYNMNTSPLEYTIYALNQAYALVPNSRRIIPQTEAQLGEYMRAGWAANYDAAVAVKESLRSLGYGKESAPWSWAFP